jgi:hypothetical protein
MRAPCGHPWNPGGPWYPPPADTAAAICGRAGTGGVGAVPGGTERGGPAMGPAAPEATTSTKDRRSGARTREADDGEELGRGSGGRAAAKMEARRWRRDYVARKVA